MHAADALSAAAPGRVCPADYRYSPRTFDRPAEIRAEILYVVGGLYGNLQALHTIERLATAESTEPTIVFNGDFHWFDAEATWFADIERHVAGHRALRGNVETEIARPGTGAGCGCAYPPSVDGLVVQRSNAILALLRTTAQSSPGARARLAALPMHLTASVGGLRIAIVHGDAHALAGWSFAHDALDRMDAPEHLAEVQRLARTDLFASTHTCLAALRQFRLADGTLTIVNNGAAGMANFAGSHHGLITRIATVASPHAPLYGVRHGALFVDALAVDFDRDAFVRRFLRQWPEGSPAHLSYFGRIVSGPDYALNQARPRTLTRAVGAS